MAARSKQDLEARLIRTVPLLMRHLLAHARRKPSWTEMTYQQYNVMRIVAGEGPTAQADIARRLLVSAPVVTRLASALVEAELIERGNDPHDKRSVVLHLTEEGTRRVTAMRKDLLRSAGELLEPLPHEQREGIADALEQLEVLLPVRRSSARR
ncbi:MAG: MarR family transcriptional regulator [Chloroflexota bacterium]